MLIAVSSIARLPEMLHSIRVSTKYPDLLTGLFFL